MTDVKLPQSREAEAAFLGSVILGAQVGTDVLSVTNLAVSDFFDVRHAEIFEQLRQMRDAGQAIDPITLEGKLRQAGRLDYVGGMNYLINVITSTPTHLHADVYAGQVAEAARRRRIVEVAERLAKAAYAPDAIDAAVSDAVTKLTTVTNPVGGAVKISEVGSRYYDDIERRAENPGMYAGIKTRLAGFDAITGGMQPGEEIILSGEPGLGKSILGFQLVCGMAESGAPGVVYELEMSNLDVFGRRVSEISKIDPMKLRDGKLTDNDWVSLTQAVERMSGLPIWMSDDSSWTTARIRADLARLKQRHGIRWFMVDYLSLLADQYGKDKNETSEYISRQLHAICKDLNLAGLVIHSMNKTGVGAGVPGKEHLSGSGAIMYDADQIVFMTKSAEKPGVISLTWDKNRHGANGRAVLLQQVAGFPAFQEVARPDQVEQAARRDWTR